MRRAPGARARRLALALAGAALAAALAAAPRAALAQPVLGDVELYTDDFAFDPFPDLPADFGPEIPEEGIDGYLLMADPEDACSDFTFSEFGERWVALIARAQRPHPSNCTFDVKVRNAERAGASAAIVFDDAFEALIIMSKPPGNPEPGIPGVFVSAKAGLVMRKLLVPGQTRVRLTPFSAIAWMSMVMSAFLGFLALTVVLATFYVMRSWSAWLGRTRSRPGAPGELTYMLLHGPDAAGMSSAAIHALPTRIHPSRGRRRRAGAGAGGGGERGEGGAGLRERLLSESGSGGGGGGGGGGPADLEVAQSFSSLEGAGADGGAGGGGALSRCSSCGALSDAAGGGGGAPSSGSGSDCEGGSGCSSSGGGSPTAAAAAAAGGVGGGASLGARGGATRRTGGEVVCVLPCSHRFHSKCISSWLAVRRFCPVCKRDASEPPAPAPGSPAGAGAGTDGAVAGAGTDGAVAAAGRDGWQGWLLGLRTRLRRPARGGAGAGGAAEVGLSAAAAAQAAGGGAAAAAAAAPPPAAAAAAAQADIETGAGPPGADAPLSTAAAAGSLPGRARRLAQAPARGGGGSP
ncbi:hypothetical protein Rsub_02343 [Raphidocelis subcapitata]|uniref:RING-type domain-containing protein n=1 Tax=Raphidocelis subcapitata TaxID=307507 RepID=A0A2V0NXS2_9CHLO|nr:hypothetical protein Rsub_02343 [Raphidocelis subcapitata]|eukprot:GBF89625.1 hypothetical protein Rsub_02343 [Raphidocelis subcapitata]